MTAAAGTLSPVPAFTHIVPLGLSCRVTHQVRRFFGTGIAYPFDWWISPLPGLARFLANPDPERIYSRHGLEEMNVDGRVVAIRSVEFGIELFHEFPRARAVVGGNEVSVVAADWPDHVAAARDKHGSRLQRLLDADQPGNRILFMRHGAGADATSLAEADDVGALRDILRAGWPAARVELLLVNVPIRGRLPADVRLISFEDRPGPASEEWQGDSERWAAGFAAEQLRLDGEGQADAPLQWSNGPPD